MSESINPGLLYPADHKVTDSRYKIVCAACGKIWGLHTFDTSCRTWATLVFSNSVIKQATSGLVGAASAVPQAPRGHDLIILAEQEVTPF